MGFPFFFFLFWCFFFAGCWDRNCCMLPEMGIVLNMHICDGCFCFQFLCGGVIILVMICYFKVLIFMLHFFVLHLGWIAYAWYEVVYIEYVFFYVGDKWLTDFPGCGICRLIWDLGNLNLIWWWRKLLGFDLNFCFGEVK